MTSPQRREGLVRVAAMLEAADEIVLTTHVNADGDGAGSEAALAGWLAARGKQVAIVNPTPFPGLYRHLLTDPDQIGDPGSERAAWALESAQLFVVLDTGEPRRVGRVLKEFGDRPVAILDHHPPGTEVIAAEGVRDPSAAATGELVYDLLLTAGEAGEAWPAPVAEAIYTAIISDTGSFRYANTTPRTHRIAADLIERGVDPEAVYRRIYATMPLRRIELLRASLEHLVADPALPVTWITVPRKVVEELSATSEDMDGIVEYARSIEGTEVALLFREVPDGSTKISFRSNGAVDVNALAREFGGGGHVKAAGAVVGAPLRSAREAVLESVRRVLAELEMTRETR
jgi:phosphoesterase RecJ-like protein